MIHRDTITDRNGTECDGGSSGKPDSRFDCIDDFIQMNVPRDHFIGRTGYADDRSVQFRLSQSHGFEERAVRGLLDSLFHDVASHSAFSCAIRRS